MLHEVNYTVQYDCHYGGTQINVKDRCAMTADILHLQALRESLKPAQGTSRVRNQLTNQMLPEIGPPHEPP